MKPILFTTLAALILFSSAHPQKHGAFSKVPTDHDVIYGITFTEYGEALGVADDRVIRVYSVRTMDVLNEFSQGHSDQILSVDISFDSSLMVSGGKDSTIVIWDFITGSILESLHYQKGIITSVQFSPDCRYLASGGTDDRICLYDMMQNRVIREFTLHDDDVTSVVFSPDGKWLASSGADRRIFLYDVETGQVVDSVSGHKKWVRDLAFSRDGKWLLSCGDDSKIISWNLEDPACIRQQFVSKMAAGWMLTLDVKEESGTFACGGQNGKARIVTRFGTYRASVGAPVTQILFKPGEPVFLKIATATRGRGVLLMDGNNMKWDPKKISR